MGYQRQTSSMQHGEIQTPRPSYRPAARKKHVLGLMAHITDLGLYSATMGLCLMTLPSPLILTKCWIVTNIIRSLKFRSWGGSIEDSVPLMNHICIWNPVIDGVFLTRVGFVFKGTHPHRDISEDWDSKHNLCPNLIRASLRS